MNLLEQQSPSPQQIKFTIQDISPIKQF